MRNKGEGRLSQQTEIPETARLLCLEERMKLTMVVRTLLFVGAVCSAARAGVVYTFTDADGGGFTYTTPNFVPVTGFWVGTSIPAANLTSCTPDPGQTCQFASFFPSGTPDSAGANWPEIIFSNICPAGFCATTTYFPGVSFSADGGPYTGQFGGTLSIIGTPDSVTAGVPEPSPFILLLTTMLAVVLMARKRIAQRL